MKKKCRVYKSKSPNYKDGGSNEKMTQDSKNDPVYEEKTNNFVNWLQGTSTAFKEKEMLKQQMEMQQQMQMMPQNFMQLGGSAGKNDVYWPDANSFGNLNFGAQGDYASTRGLQGEADQANGVIQPSQDFLNQANQIQINQDPVYGGDIDYGIETGPAVDTDAIVGYDGRYTGEEFGEWGHDNPNNPENQTTEENPYIPYSAAITTGMDMLSYLGETDERRSEEDRLTRKMTNVHEFNPTEEDYNRGDYLANTKKEGDYFRPPSHTRGLYSNTAQDGKEVRYTSETTNRPNYVKTVNKQNGKLLDKFVTRTRGDKVITKSKTWDEDNTRYSKARSVVQYQEGGEQDLSEAEIADLLAQGYQLEYLD